jgi:hypothetical protein
MALLLHGPIDDCAATMSGIATSDNLLAEQSFAYEIEQWFADEIKRNLRAFAPS